MAWPLLGRHVAETKTNVADEVKLIPKLPLNGPSGQLRTDILIGRAGEIDLRPSAKRAPNLPQLQIPASARNRSSKFSETHGGFDARSLSSRSWRKHAPEELQKVGQFATGLQRIDHVHRLRPLPEDGIGTLHSSDQADDERLDQDTLESLGVPKQAAAALTAGTNSSKSLFSTTSMSSCASLGTTMSNDFRNRRIEDIKAWKVNSLNLLGLKGKTQSSASRQSLLSEVVVLKGESEPWVLDRLRACFQHSFAEVKAKIVDLERILASEGAPEGSGQKKATKERDMRKAQSEAAQLGDVMKHVNRLQTAFDLSGLDAWERPCPIPDVKPMVSTRSISTGLNLATTASQELTIQSESAEQEANAREMEVEVSTSVEAHRSLESLKFIRWLCGLSAVENNMHLEAACRVLCEVLQPLQPPPGFRSSRLGDGHGHAPDLSHAAAHLLEDQMGQVSVVHCEGSLIDAIEQGLLASHARPWPQPVPVQPTQRRETARRIQQHQLQLRQAEFIQQKASLIKSQQRLIAGLNPRPEPEEPSLVERTSVLETKEDAWQDASPPTPEIFGVFQPMLRLLTPSASRAAAPANPKSSAPTAGCRGDPDGYFAIRRKLLSPSLRGFGSYRRQDTCVLWTGSTVVGSGMQSCPDNHVDAVCYPPCGWVPLHLLNGTQTAWTIMPNSFRYGPTLNTSVRLWQVRIDFADGLPSAVERLLEVPVKGMAVDCAAHGEPFCIIFWPDMLLQSGIGIEAEVSGLTGPVSELNFFYQVAPFRQEDMHKKMVQEARRLQELACNSHLWPGCGLPVEKPPRRLRRASASEHLPRKGLIEPMSHPNMDITVDGVDLVVTVRGAVAAVKAEFFVVRFGGEADVVPRAAQAQRLPNSNFLIRVKIPLPRARYQLRIKCDPDEEGFADLCYSVTFNDTARVPALLTSLDEPLAAKFGYAPVTAAAQAHGAILLSPLMYRIPAGTAYLLIYVDKAVAVQNLAASEDTGDKQTGGTRLTSLFASRLNALPVDGAKSKSHSKSKRSPLQLLQAQLGQSLGPYAQDSCGDVHLDVSAKDGKCVRRLRERPDMPGFFEGFLTFGQVDAQSKIRLFMRLPGLDIDQCQPRLLCEWLICRAHGEPLPKGFT